MKDSKNLASFSIINLEFVELSLVSICFESSTTFIIICGLLGYNAFYLLWHGIVLIAYQCKYDSCTAGIKHCEGTVYSHAQDCEL